MKGVNIFLADGFEDVEAVATYDVLRRGGVDVRLIAISDDPFVISSHGLTVGVETSIADLEDSARTASDRDVMIFPGGMPGSKKLAGCRDLIKLMKSHYAAGGTLAAICAAPGLVLSQLDDLKDVEFTCFEGFQDPLIAKGAKYNPQPAITCGRIITGRSAAHAVPFALEILKRLKDDKTAGDVHQAMFLY